MPSIGERELRERADQFIRALHQAGFRAEIIEAAFRDWQAKVSVGYGDTSLGNVLLYYKKNGSFTFGLHELKDKRFNEQIENCWKDDVNKTQTPPDVRVQTDDVETRLCAYVDGSYIGGKTGYGAIVTDGTAVVARFSGHVDETADTRQVAGELRATMAVLAWCIEQHINEIEIYYDYEGIEKWATGSWRAKQPLTQAYANYLSHCPVTVHWSKVESHSGNYWNDLADQLAKQGAQAASVSTDRPIEPIGATDDRLAEVEYYYQHLRPYRESTFDFITLATAIQRVFAALGTTIDTTAYRFDFNHLERLYTELKDRLRQ